MPARWTLFRILCVLQMLIACYFTVASLLVFFRNASFSSLLTLASFFLVFLLCVLGIQLVNNNYPDIAVTGAQKTYFNRLFLANFLLLAPLWGLSFAEYRRLREFVTKYNESFWGLPFSMLMTWLAYALVIVFQLLTLYGLYALRRELYRNAKSKQFDFEQA